MRLLLDTHVALWGITDDPRLSEGARRLILAPSSELFVSAASVWEIGIKHSLGRSSMPISAAEAIEYFNQSGYDLLSVTAEHAAYVETLPSIHADPFDRMLVAQALFEPMRLVTHDAVVARYSDAIILV